MRPNYQSQKPEAALQRALEFISVGKEKDALQSLHDLIKDRRHKQWSQTYEQIMLKYVELCVTLRNSALAKDGLYQYKIITQQVAVKSLETVLEKFLTLAEQKTLEAQKHSIDKIEEIDDLDIADAPENLLLSFVSGAVAQDRMDRTVLSPWLRFLWDTYRNCLDLLRNNIYVEQLYHHIARQSFTFCFNYQRRNEFRKLSEMLRLHLSQVQKAQQSTAAHAIRLNNIDSLCLMLETRLIQLDTAINMELWQEAYKSAEDLHNLMQIGKDKDKKIVKPSSYVNYYDKIALVFWKSGNTLFHAVSLLQKFNIYKDMKKQFTDDEAMDQATRVLLATLSISDSAEHPSLLTKHLDIEEQHMANTRVLSALLRLPITPTRIGIMKEIVRLNLPELASSIAYELYKCIETDFNPMRIASKVQKMLIEIEEMNKPAYSQYSDSIKLTVAFKVVKQVSCVYESLSLSRFAKIIPFYNRIQFEQFLVDICKEQSVKAHIDHRNNCISFGTKESSLASDLEDSNECSSEMSKVRMHLGSLYSHLNEVYLQIKSDSIQDIQAKLNRQVFIYVKNKEGDFERILTRRKKIENYKESSEQMKQQQAKQAQLQANKQEEKRRMEEMKKLLEENKENEKRRKIEEQEQFKRKIRADNLQKQKNLPFYAQLVKEYGEDVLENMDPDQLIKEKRERLEKDRKDQHTKMLQQEKKYGYIVRAFHLEEMLILKQISQECQKMAPEMHDQYETRRIQKEIQDYEKSFETYANLTKVMDDAKKFMRDVISSHADEFVIQKELWEKQVTNTREEILKNLAEKRMEKDRRAIEQKKRLQEETRRLEEEKRVLEQKREALRVADEKEKAQKRDVQQEQRMQKTAQTQPTIREQSTNENGPNKTEGNKYVPPARRQQQQQGGAQGSGSRWTK